MLADTAYGKSKIRLVKVSRGTTRHQLHDLTIAVQFKGDYDASYSAGDNTGVLPTDTMKNTVYALAATQPVDEPERFGLALAQHFISRNSRLAQVRIDLTEHVWRPIAIGDREHGKAFMRRGPETRSARVTADRQQARVEAGIADLVILKSAQSAFADFLRDEFTTLPETHDRLLATSLTATWRYQNAEVNFGPVWRGVHATLLETFALHNSLSVQHTLYAMGRAVLEAIDAIESITIMMPNRHHLPVDLTAFGLENRNEVFVATEEPYGLIEATLTR